MAGDFRNIKSLAAGPTGPIITPNDPYPLLDRKEVRRGTATPPVRGEYYDHDRTITTAGPVDPINPASLVYNREQVHNDIGQNAEFLQVINRGRDDLFVRACHEGTMEFADETLIAPGDTKEYLNIYELRCRSPTSGLIYTVTEFYVEKVCCPETTSGGVTSVSGDIVQVKNVSGTCLCVSGVVSSFPAAISRATITSTVVDSGVNVFTSGIEPINPPAFEIIELSFEDPNSQGVPIISITHGGVTMINMLPTAGDLGPTGNFQTSVISGGTGNIQHTQILLDSGDIMNLSFTVDTFIHILRIIETNLIVGR